METKKGTKAPYAIDDELLQDITQVFIESNLNIMASVSAAMECGKIEEAHRLMHILKSTVPYFGLEELGVLVQNAEGILIKGMKLPDELFQELEEKLAQDLQKLTERFII